jgi:hypothetical protein
MDCKFTNYLETEKVSDIISTIKYTKQVFSNSNIPEFCFTFAIYGQVVSKDVDWTPLCNKAFFHSANHLLHDTRFRYLDTKCFTLEWATVLCSEKTTTTKRQITMQCFFSYCVDLQQCVFLRVCPSWDTTNPILEPFSQPPAGSLPVQPPNMSPSQPPPCPSWTTFSYKRGRPTQESADQVAKHAKDNLHLSPLTITTIEDSEATPTPSGPTSIPKLPPIYIQNVTTIPPLLQLLDQTAHQQYVITALANNQVWHNAVCKFFFVKRGFTKKKLTTALSQMCRWSLDTPMPTQGLFKCSPLCSLWWQPSRQLQRLYSLQGPATKDLPLSPPQKYTPPALIQQTLHTQLGVSYAQIT